MVLAIIDEEARRKSMIRCPRFEECESSLCPLDPYLGQAVFVPGKPLCHWYYLWRESSTLEHIPPLVVDRLSIYIVALFKNGVFRAPRSEMTG